MNVILSLQKASVANKHTVAGMLVNMKRKFHDFLTLPTSTERLLTRL